MGGKAGQGNRRAPRVRSKRAVSGGTESPSPFRNFLDGTEATAELADVFRKPGFWRTIGGNLSAAQFIFEEHEDGALSARVERGPGAESSSLVMIHDPARFPFDLTEIGPIAERVADLWKRSHPDFRKTQVADSRLPSGDTALESSADIAALRAAYEHAEALGRAVTKVTEACQAAGRIFEASAAQVESDGDRAQKRRTAPMRPSTSRSASSLHTATRPAWASACSTASSMTSSTRTMGSEQDRHTGPRTAMRPHESHRQRT